MSGFLNDLNLGEVEADPNYIGDGKYPATIIKSEISAKKSDPDNKSWVITYKLTGGKFAGKTQSEWFALNPTGDNAEFKKSLLKQRVLSLGVPESRINDVDPDYFVATDVIIQIKHNGAYQNVGTVELVGSDSPATNAVSAGPAGAM